MSKKLSFAAFAQSVRLPNVGQQTAVNADPGVTDRSGYNIEYDEEHRFILIESRKPNNPKLDGPVVVPLENVKFFNLALEKAPEAKK